jgi:hypothetical protein
VIDCSELVARLTAQSSECANRRPSNFFRCLSQLWSRVLEQPRQTDAHMQRLVAVEDGWPRTVGDEVQVHCAE